MKSRNAEFLRQAVEDRIAQMTPTQRLDEAVRLHQATLELIRAGQRHQKPGQSQSSS